MRMKLIAFATLASVLAFAPAALAFGGGGGGGNNGGGAFSGSFVSGGESGTFQGTVDGSGNFSGSISGVTASEPLAALAVGLGLLGARYLRRRR
jgi:hypothetical protein